MNNTTKTIIAIVVIILVLAALFKVMGWGSSDQLGQVPASQDSQLNASNTAATNGSTNTNGSSNGTASGSNVSTMSNADMLALIKTARIRVPQTGVDVQLSQGSAAYVDSAVKGRVAVGSIIGKVTTNDGYDVFVDMTTTIEGRSSVLHHVAVFHNAGQAVAYTSSVYVGDSLVLNSVKIVPDPSRIQNEPKDIMISTDRYTVSLSYLDRKNGESSTTTPSVLKTLSLYVKGHIVTKS